MVVGRWEDERNVLYRWDQLGVEPTDGPADVAPLVVAGVAAAVVVPEREPRRWFSWHWRWDDALLTRLLDEGRLVRPAPGWLAVPTWEERCYLAGDVSRTGTTASPSRTRTRAP